MSRDDAILFDIDHAARLACQFVLGMDRDQFLSDDKTQSAAICQLVWAGDAIKQLSSKARAASPQISWAAFAEMSDDLLEHYYRVDLEAVWRTVQADVPELVRRIAPLVPKRDQQK